MCKYIYFLLPTCCDICHIQYSSQLIYTQLTVDCALRQIFAVEQKMCYGNHCSLMERCNIVNIRTPEPLQGRGIDIITVARGWLQTISGWGDLWWCATVQPRICATNATLQHTETTEGWLPSKRIETFCSATGIKCELSCISWYHWLRVEQIVMYVEMV